MHLVKLYLLFSELDSRFIQCIFNCVQCFKYYAYVFRFELPQHYLFCDAFLSLLYIVQIIIIVRQIAQFNYLF